MPQMHGTNPGGRYRIARGIAVLCAARTGSSMTMSLLFGRLGHRHLGEYRPGRGYDWSSPFLVKIISDASDFGKAPFVRSDPEVDRLIEDPEVAFLCTERRDLINQLLSLAIARKTRVWHVDNFREGSVGHDGYLQLLERVEDEVDMADLDQMLLDIRVYEELKARLIRPAVTVYYEDIEHEHQQLFPQLGLERDPPVTIASRRVVPDELKQRVIRNVDAIERRVRHWMDRGWLRRRELHVGSQ